MTVFESLLNREFYLWRRDRSADGQGGWPFNYIANGTVQGRMSPGSSRERVVSDVEEREVTHTFYCLAGEDIGRGDLISTESTINSSDLVVEVDGVREPSLAGKHLEMDCHERQKDVA